MQAGDDWTLPGSLIAEIAAAVIAAERKDHGQFQSFLEDIEATVDVAALMNEEPWHLGAEDIIAQARAEIGRPALPADNCLQLSQQILWLQRLDRWHMPMTAIRGAANPALDTERAAAYFAQHTRLNEEVQFGTVIPASRSVWRSSTEQETGISAVLGLLAHVTYIPRHLGAVDAGGSGEIIRDIQIRYHPPRASGPLSTAAIEDDFRVAVAPVCESASEVAIKESSGGGASRYAFVPACPDDRLEKIVHTAVAAQASILCLPEVTVLERQIPIVQEALRAARLAFLRTHDRIPPFLYLIAGVAGPPLADGEPHRNFLIVMQQDGTIRYEQPKLYRWDLEERHQGRFGLAPRCHTMLEDIEPGSAINIADLDGFGRFLAMICADMAQDRPGFQLLRTCAVDWVFAPIMDGSTCWTNAPPPPWIISRAANAATASGGCVLVANSMTLTWWNNDVIDAEAPKVHNHYDRCGFSLLLRKGPTSLLRQHGAAALPPPSSPVVQLFAADLGCGCWNDHS